MENNYERFLQLIEIDMFEDMVDIDTFESVFNSLTTDEQETFEGGLECDPLVFTIAMKIAYRILDMGNGYTTLDNDGVLHVTPLSSLLEICLSPFCATWLLNNGYCSVKDVVLAIKENKIPNNVMVDFQQGASALRKDNTIVLDVI